MRTGEHQLRPLIADTLHQVKVYNLPSVCERYGLEPGDEQEAFASKRQYVLARLEGLADDEVFRLAKEVLKTYPSDTLQAAVEKTDETCRLVSDLTRHHLAEALDRFPLSERRPIVDLLGKHWPDIYNTASFHNPFDRSLADDIERHLVKEDDWTNREVLEQIGVMSCSQAKLFAFIEDIMHPIHRSGEEQERLVTDLNRILKRDGYKLARAGAVSGYPVYKVVSAGLPDTRPADDLISETLSSFDESGVHTAWEKALSRRSEDPDGAITAAKTLLETVCKHILDEAGETYGDNDDLPKLYKTAATHLSLAPSQHTEETFRVILGSCEQIVGRLSAVRNKLGDAHGQGRNRFRPGPRHAELAVNLAGSVAMFLVSTWNARKS